MKRPIIAREGWMILLVLFVITVAAGLYHWALAILPGALLLLSLWFFRDPERPERAAEGEVVAPADGKVMFVQKVEEPRFMGGEAILVSIFLSIFDVHINRTPVGGTITYRDYMKGQFRAAWGAEVGDVNERSYIGIDTGKYRVLVSQVAGLVARRIITWPQVGDKLKRGERFGLIRFGSCTQVWLPPESEILVKPGDRVVGGETVIGRLPR